MKSKFFLFALIIVLFFYSFLAFAQDERIALIIKASINPFFMEMKKGAKDCARRYNVPLDIFSIKFETDVDEQISIIQNLIKSNEYGAIILAPADSKKLVPFVREALENGIYVINVDNELDEETMKEYGVVVPFVGPDNFSAAKEVGEYVKFKLKGKGNVIIVEGMKAAKNAILRKNGFVKGLSGANINIVTYLQGEWHRNKAFNEILSFFKCSPKKIDAILCANDEMALGVIQALELLGKDNIMVTGYDNTEEVRTFLALHRISATVEQNPYIMGFFGVKYGKILIEKGHIPPIIKVPTTLITNETFGKKIGFFLPSDYGLKFRNFKKGVERLAKLFGEELFIKNNSQKIQMDKLKIFDTLDIDVIIAVSPGKKLLQYIRARNIPTVIVDAKTKISNELAKYVMHKISDLFIGWERTYKPQKGVSFINWR